ncbi:MAG: type II toxin-antitoxin system HicA family toxin [Elusimicrobiota bacterium]
MKTKEFIRYLSLHNCVLFRQGKKHSVFINLSTRKISTVPRHRELNDFLARKICKDLGITISRN